MNKFFLIVAFICISFIFWLAIGYFFPMLVTINFIENKLFYLVLKNLIYALLVVFLANFFFKKMRMQKAVALLFMPIVLLPLIFSFATFYLFMDSGFETLRDLVFYSSVESCVYWVFSIAAFYGLQQCQNERREKR